MGMKKKYDYSPQMRRAMYEGLLKAAKQQGMTLSTYCQTMWEEDWRAAGQLFARFLPKELTLDAEINVEHTTVKEAMDFTAIRQKRERYLEPIEGEVIRGSDVRPAPVKKSKKRP